MLTSSPQLLKHHQASLVTKRWPCGHTSNKMLNRPKKKKVQTSHIHIYFKIIMWYSTLHIKFTKRDSIPFTYWKYTLIWDPLDLAGGSLMWEKQYKVPNHDHYQKTPFFNQKFSTTRHLQFMFQLEFFLI